MMRIINPVLSCTKGFVTMRKKKLTAVVVIFSFFINTLPGTMLNPSFSRAYHRDDDQQGHTGTLGGAGDCSKPNGKPCPPKRSPVDIKTGEFSDSYQDLFIPGRGLPLQVTRSYNSRDIYEGPFGHGWKFNMEIKLTTTTSGSQEVVTIRTADGVRLEFNRNQDGSYSAPAGWSDHLVKNSDGSFTWTQGLCSGGCSMPRYQFNSSGYLVSITDPNNNQMTFAYDSNGKLTQVTDAPGRMLNISYGSNKKIAMITDPAGRTFTYGYDGNDNLITCTDPAGNTIAYGYDGAHNLTGISDARGNTIVTVKYDDQERVTEYTENGAKWTYSYYPASNTTYKYLPNSWNSWAFKYDTNGLIVSDTDPLGNTNGYTYNDKLYMVSITDAKWSTTTFEYDDRGNRTGITDPLGNKTIFAYHPTFNEVTAITDALGRTTTLAYDDWGNPILKTDPVGNKTSWSYNQYGQIVEKADALGNITKYGYDAYGNANSLTDTLGNTTTMTRDLVGNVTKLTDARKNTTTYGYDVLGNLVSVTDALGNTTSYEYDQNSNLTKMVDAAGNAVRYENDAYNRLTKVTDPLGNAITRSYDTPGRMTSETDGNGSITTYSYDLRNRLTKKTLADGTELSKTYDGIGNVLAVVDGKGNSTSYGYDAMGRLTQIVYADGTKELFTYDKVGRTVGKADQIGNIIGYTYNDLDQLTTITYPDNTQATFGQDVLGRLVSANNANTQISYTYDELSRVTKAVQDGRTVEYSYDQTGNRTKLVYPGGAYLTYDYNALNLPTRITDSNGEVFVSLNYDNLSKRSRLTYGNGTDTTYEYDVGGRLTGVTTKKTSTGQVIANFGYTYDNSFNRTSMTDVSGTEIYTFDKKYQVVKAQYPNGTNTSYTYDNAYNRTGMNNGTIIEYSVNNMNQYTSVAGIAFSYDQNGNVSSDGSRTYSYDHDNRLIQIVSNGNTITLGYDALGRLVYRTVNKKTTNYVHDGDRIIAEIGPADEIVHYVFGHYLDEILGIVKTEADTKYYCYLDGLGSVRSIAGSDATIIESYWYDIYGRITLTDALGNALAKSGIGNSSMFAGRLYDTESGLYYYRARHYDPNNGRFLQMDPAGQFLGGLNLYSYVGNDPVNFVDPSGMFTLISAFLSLVAIGVSMRLIYYYLDPREVDAREDRRLKDWALGEKMNKDVYGSYPENARKELKRVQDLINEHYLELKHENCNSAVAGTIDWLLKQKPPFEHLNFGNIDFKTKIVDVNVIELIPKDGTRLEDTIIIYLGPDTVSPPHHFGDYPIYNIKSHYTNKNTPTRPVKLVPGGKPGGR
jgi:RHS repeat-associated protein